MVLFLDFDGVMHEYDADESNRLRHASLFAEILREHPNIVVVIDSEWRRTESIAQLTGYFPIDVSDRFVGVTGQGPRGLRQRERECWAWLVSHGRTNEHWIAIEDNLDNFGSDLPGFGAVLFVDPAVGLDLAACSNLRAMIERPTPGPYFCYERSTLRGWSLWT